MTDNLSTRLRSQAILLKTPPHLRVEIAGAEMLLREAADEIDRLRAQIAQARGHLGGCILQETQDGGSPDPDVVAADDALSRGSQGATEPSVWEYGFNTGSTYGSGGARSSLVILLSELGAHAALGDRGSRIGKRRRAGRWQPLDSGELEAGIAAVREQFDAEQEALRARAAEYRKAAGA